MTGQLPRDGSVLRQNRISDQVVDHITRYIADNRLQPGDKLPSEVEFSRAFGVSRPTVREATNTLVGRGMIATASGKTPTVQSLSKDPFSNIIRHGLATQQLTMIQVLEVRLGLESQAAALAAENRTRSDIKLLKAITDQMPEATGNVQAFTALDARFHEALAHAAQNPLLRSILSGVSDIAIESARTGLARARNAKEWKFILKIHQRIAEAVVSGDPADARRHMTAHFESALGRMRRG